LAPGDNIVDLRLEWEVETAGRRAVLLNARRLEHSSSILLAIDDVTDKESAGQEVRAYQARLQKMAFDAALTEELERRRIATHMHDYIGQSLALAEIKLTSLREAVSDSAQATFDEAIDLLEQAIVDTRTLIFDLSPPVLYELGLREALSWLVEQFAKRHRVLVEVSDDDMDKPLDDATAGLVFRAVRELLTNVFKHAKTLAARVSLRRTGDHVEIEVADQGVGFDANAPGLRPSDGFGLFSVREQIARLGGRVEITSAPGQGTRVRMWVPVKADGAPGLPGGVATP
jgi:signal transduction histidine kinase